MKRKSVGIEVHSGKGIQYIKGTEGQKLSELLQNNHIDILNICQGNGNCGKCKVKLKSGRNAVTETEKKLLSEGELRAGIRLACKVEVESDLCVVLLEQSEEEMIVEGIRTEYSVKERMYNEESVESYCKRRKDKENNREQLRKNVEIEVLGSEMEESYFIAIDLGTTTIAMALVEQKSGNVQDTFTSINHQRKFGADVINRILAANDGKAEELKRLVEQDLWKGICKLTLGNGDEAGTEKNVKKDDLIEQKYKNIEKITIAGNTTMIHLLMGYSCKSLGKYPFASGHLGQIDCALKECISLSNGSVYEKIPVTILPGISAFVGSDIVAGMIACSGFKKRDINLLIDLGTNGEIVLGNEERVLVTSTAAGPAFEGGNIICGTASIPGAISGVKIQNQRAVVRTIKGIMPPVGICGTGLVSAIAGLKENHLIDERGVLRFPYPEHGFPLWIRENGERISIYQKDIREFQMAKAAIRSGIEILMEEFGCQAEEISRIYLAGGFGTELSIKDAVMSGILPKEFLGRTERIGNGALYGAVIYGLEQEEKCKFLYGIKIRSISLTETEGFREKFMTYLDFGT